MKIGEILGFVNANVPESLAVHFLTESELTLVRRAGSIRNDDDAAKLLGVSSATFTRKKPRLMDRLGTLIALQGTSGTERNLKSSTYEILRGLCTVHILKDQGHAELAVCIAKKHLKEAMRNGNSDLSAYFAKFIGRMYRLENKRSRVHQYYALVDKYTEELGAIWQCQKRYYQVEGQWAKKSDETNLKDIVVEINRLRSKVSPHAFHFYYPYYIILYADAISRSDYKLGLRIASEGVKYFKSLPERFSSAIASFQSKASHCYLKIGSVAEANALLQEEEVDDVEINHSVQSIKLQHQILLFTHQKKYNLALDRCNQLLDYCEAHDVKTRVTEIGHLYKVYLSICLGKEITEVKNIQQMFGQSILTDTRARRVSAVIATILYYTYHTGSVSYIEENHEAISTYVRTHIRGNKSRAKLFLKLLLTLPKRKYNIRQYNRISDQCYSRLTNLSPTDNSDTDEVEVVPYEDLWHLICQRVGTPYKKLLNTAPSQTMVK